MRPPSDPEASKAKTRQLDILLLVVLALVLAGAAFQLFLRYQYVHTGANGVVRIDRVSGDSCTLPCSETGYGPQTVPYVPPPTAVPAKICHPANVVRVARTLVPPAARTPAPYLEGGARAHAAPLHKQGRRPAGRVLSYAVGLSDGHVCLFAHDVFAADVTTWTTGQDVQVCTTWSKLEQRPYYSVGSSEDAEPAVLAL